MKPINNGSFDSSNNTNDFCKGSHQGLHCANQAIQEDLNNISDVLYNSRLNNDLEKKVLVNQKLTEMINNCKWLIAEAKNMKFLIKEEKA